MAVPTDTAIGGWESLDKMPDETFTISKKVQILYR